jgi:hypothetical protein
LFVPIFQETQTGTLWSGRRPELLGSGSARVHKMREVSNGSPWDCRWIFKRNELKWYNIRTLATGHFQMDGEVVGKNTILVELLT